MTADLLEDLLARAATAAAVNAAFATAGWAVRTLSLSGAAGAFAVGFCVWLGLGWQGYAVLLSFFILSAALTRLGWRRKAAAGLAEARGGRRTVRQALANGGAGAAAALGAAVTALVLGAPGPGIAAGLGTGAGPAAWSLAFTGAFAAAAADTAGTEIGQLAGRRTWLITSLEPVPRGTDGGVSAAGTAAAAGAALAVAAVAWGVGLHPLPAAAVAAAAGFGGSLVDSVLGATLERRGVLDNERVNLLGTLAAGALGFVGALLLR